MAKQPDLLSVVSKLPDATSGKKNWMQRLQAQHPTLYGEVIALLDAHIDGDRAVRAKLPTETAFCQWLSPTLAVHGFAVGPQTVHQLFRRRRSERNGT
jgi:hypothetical protein